MISWINYLTLKKLQMAAAPTISNHYVQITTGKNSTDRITTMTGVSELMTLQ